MAQQWGERVGGVRPCTVRRVTEAYVHLARRDAADLFWDLRTQRWRSLPPEEELRRAKRGAPRSSMAGFGVPDDEAPGLEFAQKDWEPFSGSTKSRAKFTRRGKVKVVDPMKVRPAARKPPSQPAYLRNSLKQ